MKVFLGILLIILGIALGLYVGLWLCLILGIKSLITLIFLAVHSGQLHALGIALNLVRILLSGLAGYLAAFILIIPGGSLITKKYF